MTRACCKGKHDLGMGLPCPVCGSSLPRDCPSPLSDRQRETIGAPTRVSINTAIKTLEACRGMVWPGAECDHILTEALGVLRELHDRLAHLTKKK